VPELREREREEKRRKREEKERGGEREEADDGTRTHDLLHGQRVGGSGLTAP
jgi:hypothetical protein